MEPFVPEPEERLAQRGKPEARGASKSNNNGRSNLIANLQSHPLFLPVIALLVLVLLVMLGIQGQSLAQLRGDVAALQQAGGADSAPNPVPTGGGADNPSSGGPGDGTSDGEPGEVDASSISGDRLDALERRLNRQVSELDTMRKMVSEVLSQFDGDIASSITSEMTEIRRVLTALRADMDAELARVASPDLLADQRDTWLEEAEQRFQGLVSAEVAPLAERLEQLAKLENDLQQRLDSAVETLEQRDVATRAEISERLNSLRTESGGTEVVASSGQLAALEDKLAAVEARQEELLDTAGVEALVAPLEERVATLTGELEDARRQLEQRNADLAQWRDDVDQQLAELESAAVTPATVESLAGRVDELAEARRNRDATWAEMNAISERLSGLEEQVRQSGTGSDAGGNAATGEKLAALEGRTGDLRGALEQLRSLVEQQERDLAGLRSRLNERLAATDARLEELVARSGSSSPLNEEEVANWRETLKVLKEHHPYGDFPGE